MLFASFNFDDLCHRLQATPVDPDTVIRENRTLSFQRALRKRHYQKAQNTCRILDGIQALQDAEVQRARKVFAAYKKQRDFSRK